MPEETTPQEEIKEETNSNVEEVEEGLEDAPDENDADVVEEESVETDAPLDPEDHEIEIRKAKGEEVNYGEDVDEDDIKTISGIVEKQTASMQKELQETKDVLEVDSYIRQNPDMDKYQKVILKYMNHDSYKNIPVKNIAAMVSAKDHQKLGAQKERLAQKKTRATQTPSQPAKDSGKPSTSFAKLTAEEIDQQIMEVRGQV